jgi:TPR repeat protein
MTSSHDADLRTAPVISLDTSIAVTGLSKRTLWRRVADGRLRKVAEDARGRTLLDFPDVLKLIGTRLSAEDAERLRAADAGDPEAQADIGAVFHEAGRPEVAVYFWKLAADAGNADAMQMLGRAHASGDGIDLDEHLSIMWLGRAAAAGHGIAQAQIHGLIHRGIQQ